MTALLHRYDIEPETFWDAVTTLLDDFFATDYTSHRKLDETAMYLDIVEQELMDFDRSLPRPSGGPAHLTPSQLVSAHKLSLRYADLYSALDAKWSSQAVRRSTLRALQGIHEAYLGSLTETRRGDVLFEVSRHFVNRDLDSYVNAHRVDHQTRIARRGADNRRLDLTVVAGPIWVHDVYRHLLGSSLRGERLRKRYVGGNGADPYRESTERHFLGEPVEKPTDDDVDTALKLWTPEEERSPYCRFAAAVHAATLL